MVDKALIMESDPLDVFVMTKQDVMNAIAKYIAQMANCDIVTGDLASLDTIHQDIAYSAHRMNIVLDEVEVKAFVLHYNLITQPYFQF